MQKTLENACVLTSSEELNLKKTFECGQCFRWNVDKNGVYSGAANGQALKLWQEDGHIVCNAEEEKLSYWRNYFDLEADYSAAASRFTEPEYLKTCAEYGKGIRILRQEPWEALCSFIISQCNNIPRIKKIISSLCQAFGDELPYGLYSFPEPERLASLCENDLAPLRCGYRAEYILNAARAVTDGSLDFETLSRLPPEEAFAAVKRLHGVGDKVANCFMLYGLHHMERFPIDVWMARALKRHFPEKFDPSVLGPYAGLAQQYIFYYARSNDGADSFVCS